MFSIRPFNEWLKPSENHQFVCCLLLPMGESDILSLVRERQYSWYLSRISSHIVLKRLKEMMMHQQAFGDPICWRHPQRGHQFDAFSHWRQRNSAMHFACEGKQICQFVPCNDNTIGHLETFLGFEKNGSRHSRNALSKNGKETYLVDRGTKGRPQKTRVSAWKNCTIVTNEYY